ncbi:MAG: dTMP kinase [Helicobacteraceae bacterium]|nr:dTMP kinase [Helicobacteraceae bacterium]
MYIALEGIDTAGKSTQMQELKKLYPTAIFTKEPGGTELGVKIRELVLFDDVQSPTTELFLFLADRAEHIQRVIKPNLSGTIISDRSVVSGLAYALIQKNFEPERLVSLNLFATDNTLPNHIIILKLTKEELEYRLSQKEHDKIEARGSDYLLSIQDALIEACELLELKYSVIDATLSIEEITQSIQSSLKA